MVGRVWHPGQLQLHRSLKIRGCSGYFIYDPWLQETFTSVLNHILQMGQNCLDQSGHLKIKLLWILMEVLVCHVLLLDKNFYS